MNATIIIGLILLGVAVCIGSAMVAGMCRWNAETKGLRAQLEANRALIRPPIFEPKELDSLPLPVQRYFRAALQDGQSLVASVDFDQVGTMNVGKRWRPFTANHRVITRQPGFDWNARIAMMPGVLVRVHDAYVAGVGILHAALLGLVSVAEARDTPQIAESELMRFLAEAAWYPTALLPSQGVRWEPVSDTSAMASLSDGDVTVRLLFEFNDDGLIDSVHADARWRMLKRENVTAPWSGRFWQYERCDGMQVPLKAEVSWLLPEGRRPYWRGRITRCHYEYVQ